MTTRREFIGTLAGGLLAAPLAAEAQQGKRVWRIGDLTLGSAEREKSWLASFRQGLRELGYVEGESIVIEQLYAEGRAERLPELTKELIHLKLDVLVAWGAMLRPLPPSRRPALSQSSLSRSRTQ